MATNLQIGRRVSEVFLTKSPYSIMIRKSMRAGGHTKRPSNCNEIKSDIWSKSLNKRRVSKSYSETHLNKCL